MMVPRGQSSRGGQGETGREEDKGQGGRAGAGGWVSAGKWAAEELRATLCPPGTCSSFLSGSVGVEAGLQRLRDCQGFASPWGFSGGRVVHLREESPFWPLCDVRTD